MSYIVCTTDQFGRPISGVCKDPYRFLAQRVQERIISSKQAADATIHVAGEMAFDKAKFQVALDWERLVELAQRDRTAIVKQIDEKKLSPETLEELRSELQRRSVDDEAYFAVPWPWPEEKSA